MSNAQASAEDQAAEAQLKQLFDLIFGSDAVSLPQPSPQEKAAGQATIPIEIETVTTSFPTIHASFTRPTAIATASSLSVPVSSRSVSASSSSAPSSSVSALQSSSTSTDAARITANNPLNNANASASSLASAASSRSSASSAALASGSVAALSGNGSSQPNAGVIAGAVIASLVALLVIITLAMFLIGRRKKQKEVRTTSIDDFMSGGGKVTDLEDPTRGLPQISYHQQQYSAEPLAMADEKWRDDHMRSGTWDNGQEHYHTYGDQPYTAEYLQPSANQQTPNWRPNPHHQDDYNDASHRVADSLYSESVLDYYGTDGVSRANTMRSQTGVSRANTMRSLPETIYEGLAYEQDAPPVPPMPRRTNTTRTVESRYSDDEEDYNDVHITPQHSPVFDPANTAPLNVRRTNDKSLKDLIKARVGGRDDDVVEAGNTPSHSRKPSSVSQNSEGSKGYGWVPNFLRRADGNK